VGGNSGGSLWHRREDGHYELIGVLLGIATQAIYSPFKETIRAGIPTMSFAISLKTVGSFLEAKAYTILDSGERQNMTDDLGAAAFGFPRRTHEKVSVSVCAPMAASA